MVLGLSSAGVLLCDMLSRKRSTSLKLREFPNMPLLYVLAVVGALIKPRWTDAKTWPALKVCARIVSRQCRKSARLLLFCLRWPCIPSSCVLLLLPCPPSLSAPPPSLSSLLQVCMSTPITVTSARLSAFRKLTGWPAGEGGGALPMMAMMAEGFRLVMQARLAFPWPYSCPGLPWPYSC